MNTSTDELYTAIESGELDSLLAEGDLTDAQIVRGVGYALGQHDPEAAVSLIEAYQPDYLSDRELKRRGEYWISQARKLPDDEANRTVIEALLTHEQFSEVGLGPCNDAYLILLREGKQKAARRLNEHGLVDPTGKTVEKADDRPIAIKIAEKYDKPNIFARHLEAYREQAEPEDERFAKLVQRCYQEAMGAENDGIAGRLRVEYDVGTSERELMEEAIERRNIEKARRHYDRLDDPEIDSEEILRDFELATDRGGYASRDPEIVLFLAEIDPDRTFGELARFISRGFHSYESDLENKEGETENSREYFETILDRADPEATIESRDLPTRQGGVGKKGMVKDMLASEKFDSAMLRTVFSHAEDGTRICLSEKIVEAALENDRDIGLVTKMVMEEVDLQYTTPLINTVYEQKGEGGIETLVEPLTDDQQRRLYDRLVLKDIKKHSLDALLDATQLSRDYLAEDFKEHLQENGLDDFTNNRSTLAVPNALHQYGVTFEESFELPDSLLRDIFGEYRPSVERGILRALSEMGVNVREQESIPQHLLKKERLGTLEQCVAHELVELSDSYSQRMMKKHLETMIEQGRDRAVQNYLKHGGDVSSTEFYAAIKNDDPEMIDRIMEHYDARVDVLSRAINHAVDSRQGLKLIERLLDNGAELNYENVNPVPAATIITSPPGALRGAEAARYVDELGGDVTDPNVIKYVARKGRKGLLGDLLVSYDFEQGAKNEAMVMAVRYSNEDCLEQLMEAGAEPDYDNHRIFNGVITSTDILETLKKHGADLTANRQEVLMRAATKHATNACEWLVKQDEITLHERAIDPLVGALLNIGPGPLEATLDRLLSEADQIGGFKNHPALQEAAEKTTTIKAEEISDQPMTSLMRLAVGQDRADDETNGYPILGALLENGLPLRADGGRFLRWVEDEEDEALLEAVEPYKNKRAQNAQELREKTTS